MPRPNAEQRYDNHVRTGERHFPAFQRVPQILRERKRCPWSLAPLSRRAADVAVYFTGDFGVVIPLPDGGHRILTIEPGTAIPDRKPTLEEMTGVLRIMAGDPSAELSQERWTSYTDLDRRRPDQFRVERGMAPKRARLLVKQPGNDWLQLIPTVMAATRPAVSRRCDPIDADLA